MVIDRAKWIQHAYNMEKAGAVVTCAAIVRNVIEVGVEAEDRLRTWTDDASKAIEEGAIETARAIYVYTLSVFPSGDWAPPSDA